MHTLITYGVLKMSDTTINLRLPKQLKEDFELYAKSRDLTTSQLIRHFMTYQVQQFKKMNAKK